MVHLIIAVYYFFCVTVNIAVVLFSNQVNLNVKPKKNSFYSKVETKKNNKRYITIACTN